MTRNPRHEFSSDTRRQAYERSNGICECHLIPHVFPVACGLRLGDGNTFYEHIDPDRISGRNDLSNCAVLSRTCWKHKTFQYDIPTIAKNDRVQDAARGIDDRWKKKLPGGRDDPFKFQISGGYARPVCRRTGEPWR